jgi:hypothetical protein
MCQHERTDVFERSFFTRSEDGPEFVTESHTYCLDCGAEVEPPALEFVDLDFLLDLEESHYEQV